MIACQMSYFRIHSMKNAPTTNPKIRIYVTKVWIKRIQDPFLDFSQKMQNPLLDLKKKTQPHVLL